MEAKIKTAVGSRYAAQKPTCLSNNVVGTDERAATLTILQSMHELLLQQQNSKKTPVLTNNSR
jgi:hypothetical protein